MSAPATKVRPPPISTAALIAGLRFISSIAAPIPSGTPGLSAFTGGLSIVITATSFCLLILTRLFIGHPKEASQLLADTFCEALFSELFRWRSWADFRKTQSTVDICSEPAASGKTRLVPLRLRCVRVSPRLPPSGFHPIFDRALGSPPLRKRQDATAALFQHQSKKYFPHHSR